MIAFFGLALFEQVLVLAGSHAGWLGAAIFGTAGVYQLTSFKDVCLRHCRSPMSLLINVMLIRALLQFYLYYGDNFKVECPTGSGNLMNLFEVSREISTRLHFHADNGSGLGASHQTG